MIFRVDGAGAERSGNGENGSGDHYALHPDVQKSNCTLNRMNRGSSTAVGCIHLAPFVAGSYTVSYVVGVLELNRLYTSRPDVRLRLAEPQDLGEAHVHGVDAVAVDRTRQQEVHVLRGQPGASGRPVAARNCAAVMR